MDRREFLAAAGYGGGAVALGGGLYGRVRYRRDRLAGTLLRSGARAKRRQGTGTDTATWNASNDSGNCRLDGRHLGES